MPKPSSDPLSNEGPAARPQRRTGDYSVATLDENGNVWVVAEWASNRYTTLLQSSVPRLTNWGTYIMKINPYTLD